MGYHIVLDVAGRVKPRYIPCVPLLRRMLLTDGPEDDEECASAASPLPPPEFQDWCATWWALGIGPCLYKCELSDDADPGGGSVLHVQMQKKPYDHANYLDADYITFVEKILVPLTTEFTHCRIEHTDHGIPTTEYADDAMRRTRYLRAVAPPMVQVGRRQSRCPRVVLGTCKLMPEIYDSDPETWPDALRLWWHGVRDRRTALDIAAQLRAQYGEDADLLHIADWLQRMCDAHADVDNLRFECDRTP